MDVSGLLSAYGSQGVGSVYGSSSSSRRQKTSASQDTDTVDISQEARELLAKKLKLAKEWEDPTKSKEEDAFLAKLDANNPEKAAKPDADAKKGTAGAAEGAEGAEGSESGGEAGGAGGAGGGSGSSESTTSDLDAKIEALQQQIEAVSGQIAAVLQAPGDEMTKAAQVQPLEQRQSGLIQQMQDLISQRLKQQQQEQKSGGK